MPIYYGNDKLSFPGMDKVYYGEDLKYTSEPPIDYLKFTANTAGSTVYLSNNSNTPNCEYSFDGETWNTFPTASGSKILLNAVGDSVLVRGINTGGWSTGSTRYSRFRMGGSIAASGNIMIGTGTEPGSVFFFKCPSYSSQYTSITPVTSMFALTGGSYTSDPISGGKYYWFP